MESEKKFYSSENVSLNDALTYVRAKNLETRSTGRIDSEPSDFAAIEKNLIERNITPKDAVAQVDALIASRQDYN